MAAPSETTIMEAVFLALVAVNPIWALQVPLAIRVTPVSAPTYPEAAVAVVEAVESLAKVAALTSMVEGAESSGSSRLFCDSFATPIL